MPAKTASATEHSQQPPLLQSTEPANVVFVNIDWKAGRHTGKNKCRHMQTLADTIMDIVEKMNPTVICMSEVGETKIPLDEEQMREVEDQCIRAWNDVVQSTSSYAACLPQELHT